MISSTRSAKQDPVTIQNISLDQIETLNAGQDPSVLLQQLSPSIISYSDAGTDIGNYAQFRMRGISQSRINVTLNGVPLNDMIDQGVFFSNFSDFGNSVQSIQVQRGVGASNIGVASYGGSVNFESPRIFNDDAKTSLELTTGSFGTLRTSAEISSGLLKGNWASYGRFTRTSVEGYKNHSASDAYSLFGSIGKSGEKEIIKLTSFMGKTQNDQSYLPVLLSDISADPKTNYNHPNDTDDFEQELVMLQYSRWLNDNTSFDATAYYGGARGVFPFAIDDVTQFVYGLSNDHYGLMSHMTYDTDNWSVKGGIQAYQFDRTNYEYVAPNVQNPYDRDTSDKFEWSSFSKVTYRTGKASLYGNVQLRSVNLELTPDNELGTGMAFDKSWTFLNWVGGVNYNLTNSNSIYASIGRTSREPTRSDILNGATLEESVTDIELGWRMQNNRLSLNANAYHMSFENEISQVGALQEFSYMEIRQKVPSSRRSGLELEVSYDLNEKARLFFNSAWMTTNVKQFNNGQLEFENVEHIFAPSFILRPQLEYDFSEKMGIVLSGRHVSSSFMELSNAEDFILDAHTIANVQFNAQITPKVNFSLQLNNIFDELYFTDGAPVDLDFDGNVEGPGFRVQPPRHFYLKFGVQL